MKHNVCLKCNKEFTTTLRPSKYCSTDCRCNYSYVSAPTITIICNICSKEVTTTRKNAMYCSVTCRNINKDRVYRLKHPLKIKVKKDKCKKKELLHKNCLICNKEFYTKKEVKVFCSSTCNQKDKTIRRRELKNIHSNRNTIQTCQNCKREFQSTRIKKYCSPKCRNRYHNKYIRVDKSCVACGNEFISTWGRKFCSKECSSKHFNTIKVNKLKNSNFTDLVEFYELIASQKIGKEQFIIEVIVDKRRYRLLWTQCFGDDKGLNLMSIVDKYFNYSPLPPLKWVTHFFTRVKRRYDHIKFGTPLKHEKIKREHE